jgi:hypothetical protein
MNILCLRWVPRRLFLIVTAGGALAFCSLLTATGAMTPENLPGPGKSHPGPVGLVVNGTSAGITTEYFEQTVTDALVASGIFSGFVNSRAADVIMPMIGARGTFSGIDKSSNAPYLLSIRIIRVDTPSFSTRMAVSINAVWILYRTADKTELLHEKIYSTYTGGVFEGGLHGANRVRVALEGATRENIRIGIEMLASLNLEQE